MPKKYYLSHWQRIKDTPQWDELLTKLKLERPDISCVHFATDEHEKIDACVAWMRNEHDKIVESIRSSVFDKARLFYVEGGKHQGDLNLLKDVQDEMDASGIWENSSGLRLIFSGAVVDIHSNVKDFHEGVFISISLKQEDNTIHKLNLGACSEKDIQKVLYSRWCNESGQFHRISCHPLLSFDDPEDLMLLGGIFG